MRCAERPSVDRNKKVVMRSGILILDLIDFVTNMPTSDTGSRNSSSISSGCPKKPISSMLYLDTKFVRNKGMQWCF